MPAPLHETQTRHRPGVLLAEHVHELLAEARRRTLALVVDVTDDDLNRVHAP